MFVNIHMYEDIWFDYFVDFLGGGDGTAEGEL